MVVYVPTMLVNVSAGHAFFMSRSDVSVGRAFLTSRSDVSVGRRPT